MQTTRTIALRLLAVVMLAAVAAAPLPLAAQRGDRGLSLGLGVGRIVPLQPLASTDVPVDYELDDAGAAILAVDYWFTGWVGMRLSYQWVRTNMAEPDGPSSARIWSGYGALLLSPFAITRGVRPYFALGPGMRRYDVNAVVFDGTGDSYDV
ncbi:MAG: outer membrane beta-barrel protein, partial [Longimicrobiales bacterium]